MLECFLMLLYFNAKRVFLKMNNPFFWAGLWNPIVSMYEDPKYQFRVFGHILTISTIGFWFWDLIRGNRPEMSLNYVIFKICPKLAQKWCSCETSIPSFLGIVGDKSGVGFRIWASKVPFFGTRKRPILVNFGQKNWTSDAQIWKRRPLFDANYSQKWWNTRVTAYREISSFSGKVTPIAV